MQLIPKSSSRRYDSNGPNAASQFAQKPQFRSPERFLKFCLLFRTHYHHALLLLYLLVLPQKFPRHCSKFPPSLVPNARSFNAKINFFGGSVRCRDPVSLRDRDRVSQGNRDPVSLGNKDLCLWATETCVSGQQSPVSLRNRETLSVCGIQNLAGGLPAPPHPPLCELG